MQETSYEDSLVSIIMPVYNKERFLKQSIDSVLGQTYAHWELILIDDCSTDDSPGVIARCKEDDSRIVYIKLAQNSGAAVARNAGIEKAGGRYIAFLDADDLWMPEKLEKQLALLQKSGGGFVFAAIEMIDEAGRLVREKRPVRERVDYGFLLSNTMIACSSVVIDRRVMGDFRMPLLRKGQDYATWLSLLRKGGCALGINEVLVRYRLVAGSVSSNKLGALKRTWHVYRTQERLPFFRSLYHFTLYTVNAVKKYVFS